MASRSGELPSESVRMTTFFVPDGTGFCRGPGTYAWACRTRGGFSRWTGYCFSTELNRTDANFSRRSRSSPEKEVPHLRGIKPEVLHPEVVAYRVDVGMGGLVEEMDGCRERCCIRAGKRVLCIPLEDEFDEALVPGNRLPCNRGEMPRGQGLRTGRCR